MLRALVHTASAAVLGTVLAAAPLSATDVAPLRGSAAGPEVAAAPDAARHGHTAPTSSGSRPGTGNTRELVILVHGMGRSPASMWLLGRRLERSGYRVVRFGYPSTRGTVAEAGAALSRRASERMGDAPRVHFVGHSLGTVIIRCMLAHAPPPRAGRVVMLAPPNQGAAAADRWARWIGWAMPYVRELGTMAGSPARSLALPDGVEAGIIAGAWDGKVRVAETRLAGARDHVVVRAFHSFLMNRRDVHRLVDRFLRHGRFSPPPSVDATP
ncbi:MAG TPA: alpha/beta fold hydrolase [Longimicrobium sp.]|nr:alpha/beta fold hydrolase [Longimicrobium sp.]